MKFLRELTEQEIQILNHDLLDIEQWINGMIDGKINNCKKRAAAHCRELLKQEGADMVPASDDTAIKLLFSRDDYKNRELREQENKGQ